MVKELIIEKGFLEEFFVRYDEKDPIHMDLLEFLKQIRDFELYTDAEDTHEFMDLVNENPVLEYLINNFVPTIHFSRNLSGDVKQEEFYDQKHPFKLFFLKDYSDSENLNLKYGHEYISTGSLSERWCYYSQTLPLKYKLTKDREVPEEIRFDGWYKMKVRQHPINSIVIFDRYVLTDQSNQKLKDNLYKLLENMLVEPSNLAKLEITIIFEKISRNLRLERLHSDLVKFIKEKTGIPCKLNFIRHDKKFYPKTLNDLHSRGVYTNYFIFRPDGSLNFFKENGGVNYNGNIQFEFIFNSFEWISLKKDLQDLKKYVDKVVNRAATDTLGEEINYYPDKSNRLLDCFG